MKPEIHSKTTINSFSSTNEAELSIDTGSNIRKILELSVAQINSAIEKSDPEIAALTDIFSAIAHQSESIMVKVESRHGQNAIVKQNDLRVEMSELKERMNMAILALQFYDRFSQRINHVSENLNRLAMLVDNKEAMQSKEAWHRLKISMRQTYSDETEKQLFDKVINNKIINEKDLSTDCLNHADFDSSVELF